MAHRICGRSGTNVAALDIADDYQVFGFAVIDGLLICLQALDTELLIHGDLRLYRRNQVVGLVHDLLVELPDGLCCSLQGLAVLRERLLLDVLRNVVQHRIQSYHDGGSGLLNLCNQLINHFTFSFVL